MTSPAADRARLDIALADHKDLSAKAHTLATEIREIRLRLARFQPGDVIQKSDGSRWRIVYVTVSWAGYYEYKANPTKAGGSFSKAVRNLYGWQDAILASRLAPR